MSVCFERYIHCPVEAPPPKTNLTLAAIRESGYQEKDKVLMRQWFENQLEKDFLILDGEQDPQPPRKKPPTPPLLKSGQPKKDSGGRAQRGIIIVVAYYFASY
jgi:hypothetical protein